MLEKKDIDTFFFPLHLYCLLCSLLRIFIQSFWNHTFHFIPNQPPLVPRPYWYDILPVSKEFPGVIFLRRWKGRECAELALSRAIRFVSRPRGPVLLCPPLVSSLPSSIQALTGLRNRADQGLSPDSLFLAT